MSTYTSCPRCESTLKVAPQLWGTRIICPTCGAPIHLPAPGSSGQPSFGPGASWERRGPGLLADRATRHLFLMLGAAAFLLLSGAAVFVIVMSIAMTSTMPITEVASNGASYPSGSPPLTTVPSPSSSSGDLTAVPASETDSSFFNSGAARQPISTSVGGGYDPYYQGGQGGNQTNGESPIRSASAIPTNPNGGGSAPTSSSVNGPSSFPPGYGPGSSPSGSSGASGFPTNYGPGGYGPGGSGPSGGIASGVPGSLESLRTPPTRGPLDASDWFPLPANAAGLMMWFPGEPKRGGVNIGLPNSGTPQDKFPAATYFETEVRRKMINVSISPNGGLDAETHFDISESVMTRANGIRIRGRYVPRSGSDFIRDYEGTLGRGNWVQRSVYTERYVISMSVISPDEITLADPEVQTFFNSLQIEGYEIPLVTDFVEH